MRPPDEPDEAYGKAVGDQPAISEGSSASALTTPELHEPPYIDILPRATLALITEALDAALEAKPHEVWPARFSAKEATEHQHSKTREIVRGKKARRVLVPLARLGAAQGHSGASVYIAYFTDPSTDPNVRHYPSRPLVVKIATQSKLLDELRRAENWPRHAQGEDASFAYPWRLFPEPSPVGPAADAVLVGHFSSVTSLDADTTFYKFEIPDLWQVLTTPLNDERLDKAETVLRSVYELMHGIHRNGRIVCERRDYVYGDAYEKHLREQHGAQRQNIECLFGSEIDTQMFGRVWPNPLRLVEDLIGIKFNGVVGPVHGDLHPKNVVLDQTDRPRIIDFGWASERGHFIIDYVLMEVNLRALTLPAQISHADVMLLAEMLVDGDPIPGAREVAARANLIRNALWETVKKINIVRDWTSEYLVPQFLIAFGLLKFLDSSKNQHALLCTVLCLAKRIRKSPPPGLGRAAP